MADEPIVLVLGASGMLGHTVLRVLSDTPGYTVVGSVRSTAAIGELKQVRVQIIAGVDVLDPDALLELFSRVRPSVVINCVGLVKQLAESDDPLLAIPVNSLLPHRLMRWCRIFGARLVHLSTDCVFAGTKGSYREEDVADALDLYGRSKLLGEVDAPWAVTLRTSFIGPELNGAHGLLGWFLAQQSRGEVVKGFRRAIFSGITTLELARVIRDFILPRPDLHGIYHVGAEPISKYALLSCIAQVYGLDVAIEPDDRVAIDRSLDSSRFRGATGYRAPSWTELIRAMHEIS